MYARKKPLRWLKRAPICLRLVDRHLADVKPPCREQSIVGRKSLSLLLRDIGRIEKEQTTKAALELKIFGKF